MWVLNLKGDMLVPLLLLLLLLPNSRTPCASIAFTLRSRLCRLTWWSRN